MKTFLKTYWSDILFAFVCLVTLVVAGSFMVDHAKEHQKIFNQLQLESGYSNRQVIVAPNLPCGNCSNTIYQLQNIADKDYKSAICCLCGVSRVVIENRGGGAILTTAIARIFKQDVKKFKQQDWSAYESEFLPGHAYYFSPKDGKK